MADEAKMKPRRRSDWRTRSMARRIRDDQWLFMQRALKLEHGVIWCCWWDKAGRHKENRAADVDVFGLIDGCEMLEWLNAHEEWFVIGAWSEERYAQPVTITYRGRKAFAQRERYDMEPVAGGLVEPGWDAIPAPRPTERQLFILKFAAQSRLMAPGGGRWNILRGHEFYRDADERNPSRVEIERMVDCGWIAIEDDPRHTMTDAKTGEKTLGHRAVATPAGQLHL